MKTPVEELQKRLADAKEAYRAVMIRGRSSSVPLQDYSEADDRVLNAEREIAAATGDQYANPLDLGFVPEAAVSGPVLLQNDLWTFLTFNAVKIALDGSRSTAGTAIIEFDRCCWTSFGYPNDEALSGHPLHGRGLSAYRIFEVRNSHWVRRMFQQNEVSFPNTKPWDSQHLIFSFHDSTFECICRGIKAFSLSLESFAKIFAAISSRITADSEER